MLVSIVSIAIAVQAKASNVWALVRGPGAALVATARRIGWTVVSAVLLLDDRGKEVHLERDSPAYVKLLVDEAVRRWRWRRIEDKHPVLKQGGGGFGAHFIPIYRLINTRRSSDKWNPRTYWVTLLCHSQQAVDAAKTCERWPGFGTRAQGM